MPTVAILPVKRFGAAKQRLRSELSAEAVSELVERMLGDVLGALSAVASIDQIIVVTREPVAVQLAHSHGATVLDDDERSGHNAAAGLGIQHALTQAADRALLVPGDCPLLDPGEVEDLLARPAPPPSVLIVPDRHGTGTNALLLTPPDALKPSFGPDSARRHATHADAAGVTAELVEVPSLALDVDTPADLAALSRTRC